LFFGLRCLDDPFVARRVVGFLCWYEGGRYSCVFYACVRMTSCCDKSYGSQSAWTRTWSFPEPCGLPLDVDHLYGCCVRCALRSNPQLSCCLSSRLHRRRVCLLASTLQCSTILLAVDAAPRDVGAVEPTACPRVHPPRHPGTSPPGRSQRMRAVFSPSTAVLDAAPLSPSPSCRGSVFVNDRPAMAVVMGQPHRGISRCTAVGRRRCGPGGVGPRRTGRLPAMVVRPTTFHWRRAHPVDHQDGGGPQPQRALSAP